MNGDPLGKIIFPKKKFSQCRKKTERGFLEPTCTIWGSLKAEIILYPAGTYFLYDFVHCQKKIEKEEKIVNSIRFRYKFVVRY